MNKLLIIKPEIMEKIRFILFAAVGMVLAACSSDDLQGTAERQILPPDVTESPILFSSVKSSTTRAEATGAEAAELLDKKFVVFGYKGSATSGYDADNKVFDNYLVVYEPNTENTTDSNTKNWEYVGKGPITHATNNGITSQKVKYWDYSQPQYDFMAWSTGKKEAVYSGTPGTGQVYVSAISPIPTTSPGKALTSAYTMTGSMADLTACYISDLVTRKKSGTTGTCLLLLLVLLILINTPNILGKLLLNIEN